MAFEITCDFCKGNGIIEIEKGSVFIVCENCGQEREALRVEESKKWEFTLAYKEKTTV